MSFGYLINLRFNFHNYFFYTVRGNTRSMPVLREKDSKHSGLHCNIVLRQSFKKSDVFFRIVRSINRKAVLGGGITPLSPYRTRVFECQYSLYGFPVWHFLFFGFVCATLTSKSFPFSSVLPISKECKSCDFKKSMACSNRGCSKVYFLCFQVCL